MASCVSWLELERLRASVLASSGLCLTGSAGHELVLSAQSATCFLPPSYRSFVLECVCVISIRLGVVSPSKVFLRFQNTISEVLLTARASPLCRAQRFWLRDLFLSSTIYFSSWQETGLSTFLSTCQASTLPPCPLLCPSLLESTHTRITSWKIILPNVEIGLRPRTVTLVADSTVLSAIPYHFYRYKNIPH